MVEVGSGYGNDTGRGEKMPLLLLQEFNEHFP